MLEGRRIHHEEHRQFWSETTAQSFCGWGPRGLPWSGLEHRSGHSSLGFKEDFSLKCLKGQKPPPAINLKDSLALNEALSNNLITRAGILSRVAELYDP